MRGTHNKDTKKAEKCRNSSISLYWHSFKDQKCITFVPCGSTCNRNKLRSDMKMHYFSVLFCAVYAHMLPLAKTFLLQDKCEQLRLTISHMLMYQNVKFVFAKKALEITRIGFIFICVHCHLCSNLPQCCKSPQRQNMPNCA